MTEFNEYEDAEYTPTAIFRPTSHDVGMALCELTGEDPNRVVAIRVEARIGEPPIVMVQRIVGKR